MKEQIVTGKYLYNEMQRLLNEMNELYKAKEQLENMDMDGASNIIENEYQKIKQEYNKLSTTNFKTVI